MLRVIFSSVLSLLMMVTLGWGGCISCPQFFMFQTGGKSCCNKAGQCERPVKGAPGKECKQMPLEPQTFGSVHAGFAVAVLTSDVVLLSPALRGASPEFHLETVTVEHSPPDRNVLNSTFLI